MPYKDIEVRREHCRQYKEIHREQINQYRRTHKEVGNDYRRHLKAYRRRILNRYKRMVDCKYHDDTCKGYLVFHHPEERIYGKVSAILHFAWSKIKEEVAICEVVCSGHHAKIHNQRRSNGS